ncbi:MAG: polynucleotide adenylyltransferase PcnB [Luminiphilus sp.]|nr:polynucleotide adenylyltransferase PcnB [Luminiphilus sp.]
MSTESSSPLFRASDFSRGALQVVERLQHEGFDAFVVGGAVRDLLLGKQPKDFDVATSANPEQIKDCFRNARIVGRRFQIVHVRSGGEIIEVTTFRRGHDVSHSGQDAKSSQSGRLLRDNVYGTLDEDARRRDLTINALYYDTETHTLIDQLGGRTDIEAGIVRIIGDPADRYREDPVRMLRVIRFGARLQFKLESKTETAISETRSLLRDIPSARLFDEWLKLFMNGFSAPTFALLRAHEVLIPLMGNGVCDALIRTSAEHLQSLALRNTDQRVADGRPVTPAFLLAALYWPATEHRASALAEEGEPTIQAMHSSGQQIAHDVCQHLAIPKRFSLAMRDIWDLQPRLERRQPKKVKDLLAHRWFRAAFDLRLLREETEALGSDCSAFWTLQQQQFPELVGSARSRHDDHRKGRSRPQRRNQSK